MGSGPVLLRPYILVIYHGGGGGGCPDTGPPSGSDHQAVGAACIIDPETEATYG